MIHTLCIHRTQTRPHEVLVLQDHEPDMPVKYEVDPQGCLKGKIVDEGERLKQTLHKAPLGRAAVHIIISQVKYEQRASKVGSCLCLS